MLPLHNQQPCHQTGRISSQPMQLQHKYSNKQKKLKINKANKKTKDIKKHFYKIKKKKKYKNTNHLPIRIIGILFNLIVNPFSLNFCPICQCFNVTIINFFCVLFFLFCLFVSLFFFNFFIFAQIRKICIKKRKKEKKKTETFECMT